MTRAAPSCLLGWLLRKPDEMDGQPQPSEKSVQRLLNEGRYGARYVPFGSSGCCTYCGRPAEVQDHVPSMVHAGKRDAFKGHWLVASCWACNAALGPHPAICLRFRAEYLQRLYSASHVVASVEKERFDRLPKLSATKEASKRAADLAESAARIWNRWFSTMPAVYCPCEFCKGGRRVTE